MPDANLLTAIANVIVAAVVPFVSVWAAQRWTERNSRRDTVRNSFLRVHQDMQDFRHAYKAYHSAIGSLNRLKPDVDPLARELLDCVTALNGDCLMVGLIFDKKGDSVGRAIQNLAGRAQALFVREGTPPLDVAEIGLKDDMQRIAQEMKRLWDTA